MVGKRRAKSPGGNACRVELDVGEVVALHLLHDAPGHDVARGELAPARRTRCHEGLAAMVAQHRSMAAHRLRDQEAPGARAGEGRRMELEELEVGDHRAGAQGQGATPSPVEIAGFVVRE